MRGRGGGVWGVGGGGGGGGGVPVRYNFYGFKGASAGSAFDDSLQTLSIKSLS